MGLVMRGLPPKRLTDGSQLLCWDVNDSPASIKESLRETRIYVAYYRGEHR